MSDDEYYEDEQDNYNDGDYNDESYGQEEYQDENSYYEPENEVENYEDEQPESEEAEDHEPSEAQEHEEAANYSYYAQDQPEEPVEATNQFGDNEVSTHGAFNFESLRGALDGFGSGGMSEIVNQIQSISGGQGGGLSNLISSGGFEAIASGVIANAAHKFLGINPDTGRIIGAIAGNLIFSLGGKHNSLSDTGKLILDGILSGKYKRDIKPFVSPTPGVRSFNLDFYKERERCLRERVLFEDPEFPAIDSSLYFSHPPKGHIEWKRPAEIVDSPQLIVDTQSRFDVVQGRLGDCWLLAATSNLTIRPTLFYRVVPPDQSFVENYAGIFHFQFWRYGKWIDVTIDDRLPTENGRLIFMHSDNHNEFWSALLEKAYAKLYGSYEALEGGSTVEALEDFTGGLVEYYELKEMPKEAVLAILVRGFQMDSLFGCSIDPDPNEKEAVMANGLVRGHAYSITAINTVDTPREYEIHGGNDQEWNGPWSDGASEWQMVSAEQKQQLQVEFKNDGEFWMSIDDFCCAFEQMELCNLGPAVTNEIAAMTDLELANSAWSEYQTDGVWSKTNGTAGGCKNYETFAFNPQYGASFTVSSHAVDQDGKATIIAALLQKYRRELRVVGLDSLPIGFSVYELPASRRVDSSFLRNAHAVAKSSVFINTREVTARFRLHPGEYLIIPSTFKPDQEAEFLLRIYSTGQVQAGELYH
ncbi:Calpain catalytic domain-containing protein [Aphelenchoides besseyi]|nr:Calpain catalytic domain-containing protein [Aphelenchoides besseyi]